jgi:hypothetical protein
MGGFFVGIWVIAQSRLSQACLRSRYHHRYTAEGPRMSKLMKMASFWALCLLSAMSCTSPADSHRREGQRAATVADAAPATKAQSNRYSPISWPKLSIAQRQFSGEQMFIDRKDGKWSAWVVSVPKGSRAEAMNFFTGEQIEVTFERIEAIPMTYKITDKRGRSWTWQAGSSFLTDDRDGNNSGARYFGNDRYFIDFQDSLYTEGLKGRCPLELAIVKGIPKNEHDKRNAYWSKFLMYFDPPSQDCPNGKWESDIRSALNLRDGTMLVTIGEYVVRLRFSDFSLVGKSTKIRVENTQDIRPVVARMESEGVDDPNDYLARSLRVNQNKP